MVGAQGWLAAWGCSVETKGSSARRWYLPACHQSQYVPTYLKSTWASVDAVPGQNGGRPGVAADKGDCPTPPSGTAAQSLRIRPGPGPGQQLLSCLQATLGRARIDGIQWAAQAAGCEYRDGTGTLWRCWPLPSCGRCHEVHWKLEVSVRAWAATLLEGTTRRPRPRGRGPAIQASQCWPRGTQDRPAFQAVPAHLIPSQRPWRPFQEVVEPRPRARRGTSPHGSRRRTRKPWTRQTPGEEQAEEQEGTWRMRTAASSWTDVVAAAHHASRCRRRANGGPLVIPRQATKLVPGRTACACQAARKTALPPAGN